MLPSSLPPGDAGVAQAGGGVALGVDVDEQDPLLGDRQRGGEVDGGGRLTDAAFLVRDRDDPSHVSGPNAS